jgi:hypothetical protein
MALGSHSLHSAPAAVKSQGLTVSFPQELELVCTCHGHQYFKFLNPGQQTGQSIHALSDLL